ncbi:MAG: hypothetical protein R3B91_08035 [Planctomycetaceae bacterium]
MPWWLCLSWVIRLKPAIVVDAACVATVIVTTAVHQQPAVPQRPVRPVTAAAQPVTVAARLVTAVTAHVTAVAVPVTADAPPVAVLQQQEVTLTRHR